MLGFLFCELEVDIDLLVVNVDEFCYLLFWVIFVFVIILFKNKKKKYLKLKKIILKYYNNF